MTALATLTGRIALATFAALLTVSLAAAGLVQAADEPARPSPPKVPYEDHGACPFECCTYRMWTVNAETPVRTDRRDNAPVAFRVRVGEVVDGLTGVVVTTKLGRATIREPIVVDSDKLELRPGEVVYVVNYSGEGVWKIWARGRLYHLEIAGKQETCGGQERESVPCAAQIVEEPKTVWWAKVRNRTGHEGWTRQLGHFDNVDACG
jgi:hypothetical protein